MQMTWQNGRQLKKLTAPNGKMLRFSYDLNGQRQAKVERSYGNVVHTTKYFYNGTKLAGEKKDDTIVWYDYDQNGAPVGMRVNGLDYIFRKNLQGDITGIYNSSAELIVEYTYSDAWGAGVTVSGSAASTIGMYNSFRYRGYYYDTESGLYYLNSRYYDPVACRFINADGYVSTGQGNTGHNMYSYCGNNPINMIDLNGEDPVPTWAKNILYGTPSASDYLQAFSCNPDAWAGSAGYIVRKAVEKTDEHFSVAGRTKGPRKDPRKGADGRRKAGARERNVAHPNGEEHSRVPKGNGRNIRRMSETELFISAGVFAAACAGLIFLCADDATLIGIADDVAIAPIAKIAWDSAEKIGEYFLSGG